MNMYVQGGWSLFINSFCCCSVFECIVFIAYSTCSIRCVQYLVSSLISSTRKSNQTNTIKSPGNGLVQNNSQIGRHPLVVLFIIESIISCREWAFCVWYYIGASPHRTIFHHSITFFWMLCNFRVECSGISNQNIVHAVASHLWSYPNWVGASAFPHISNQHVQEPHTESANGNRYYRNQIKGNWQHSQPIGIGIGHDWTDP